jgi:hypothetical protein
MAADKMHLTAIRAFKTALIALPGLFVALQPAFADYQLRQITLPQPVSDIFVTADGKQTLLQLADGRMVKLKLTNSTAKLASINAKAGPPGAMPGQLPDSRLALGGQNIAAAWLINPTRRYGHGVLGDAVEAGGLSVDTSDGRNHKFLLPNNSVFEDLQPRIADLNGDGQAEVISIRSYLDAGAALAVLGFKQGRFTLLAETPAIGLANRWLNPVGVGDVDGDGGQEVAYVETPHIGGTLFVYRLRRGRLIKAYEARGFSNHKIGSRLLGLSAVADLNADGVSEMLVPDQNRAAIRIVDFAKGRLRKLARLPLPSAIASDMRVSRLDGKLQVLFLLSSTKLAQIKY